MDKKFEALRNAYNNVKRTGDSIRKSAKIVYKVGHPTIFTKAEETQLAEHCKNMATLGYGYCMYQVLELASRIADDWYYNFIRRFPDITITIPKKRELSRVLGASETNLANYFIELGAILDKYGLKNKPDAMWNVDETGISLDHTPPKKVASCQKPFVVTAGKVGLTTTIVAGSALGETIPPYIIYKGQRLTQNIMSGCLPRSKTSPLKLDAYEAALTVPNLMSAFRKTGLVPFNPEEVLPATLQELPHKSENEKVKSREERKNLRNIKLLLTDIDKQIVESLSESQLRTRKYVIPASGAAITEIDQKKVLIRRDNRKIVSQRKVLAGKRKRTQENKKKANTVTKKRKVDKVKSNNKNCINRIHQQDSQEPGPSNVKSDGWITFYDSASDDNNDDDIPCIVCVIPLRLPEVLGAQNYPTTVLETQHFSESSISSHDDIPANESLILILEGPGCGELMFAAGLVVDNIGGTYL
ncbi:hypothetical protein KUTeg_022133 [Tegillarca granosa]|uniref:Transposase n=1 Tax=Tegillarca granosa TaxID=220873 RepID=A0ABQ9E8A9_TEGGR|nr:hypothetical protein KUTeg_022133 [Tegillarca granosa]